MPKKQPIPFNQKHSTAIRIGLGIFVFLFSLASIGSLVVIETKQSVYDLALSGEQTKSTLPSAFPVGITKDKERIDEQTNVETFLVTELGGTVRNNSKISSLTGKFFVMLTEFSWYQNLASPISRILVIRSGERREEVVKSFGDILHWDASQRETFAAAIASSSPQLYDGKFYPGKYVVAKNAEPDSVATIIESAFENNIASRYTNEVEAAVPLNDTLIIASLLEREAYDFEDMRFISGVIWNRLFAEMPLQLDATLQYAKANQGESKWWPVPAPVDKKIDSPFNTYKNKGLPPSPIANPSIEAILAALNPRNTDCMFYFHDKKGGFHCTKTYEEHVALLKEYYGN